MLKFYKIILLINNFQNELLNKIFFKFKNVSYLDFPTINGVLIINGTGKITFGKGVKINSGKKANLIGGDTRMVIKVLSDAKISIGDYTGMSNSTIICHEKITIGKFVKIGGSVKIYDTDFHSLDYKDRQKKETDISKTEEVFIGDNSFIGAHSIILKGVKIGKRCIIGAGSVVAKNIPDGEIWAGNPAKFIKRI